MSTKLYTMMCRLKYKMEELSNDRHLVKYLNNVCGENKTLINEMSNVLNDSIKKSLDLLENDVNTRLLPALEKVSFSFNQERRALDEAFSLFREIEDKLNSDMARLILETCNRLRNNVDLLEHTREIRTAGEGENLSSLIHGIGSSEKIKIFLSGEFSAGKTTFIKRILGQIAGATSPFPQTGMMIKHCVGDTASFKINFAAEFSAKSESEKFSFTDFIKNFKIQDKFAQTGSIWKVLQGEMVFSDWGADKCLDFISKADGFTNAVKFIQWTHLPMTRFKEHDILKYADLYDLPGIGGKHEHSLTIKGIIETNTPDIILYLIDTGNGVPSEEGFNYIRDWVEGFINTAGVKPIFFWLYQLPESKLEDTELSQEWIEEQKKSIQSMLMHKRDKEQLSDNAYEYLMGSEILDARGSKDDYPRARAAVAKAIGLYYKIRLMEYIKNAIASLKDIPNMHEVLFSRETGIANQLQTPTEVVINCIGEIANKITIGNKVMTYDQVKQDVDQALGLTDFRNSNYQNKELESTIKSWSERIDDTIKNIVKKSAGWRWLWPGNREYSPKNGFTTQRLKQEIHENNTWIDSLYLAQSAVLFSSFHKNELPGFYLKDIESKIAESIELDLRKLKDILETTELLS